MTLRSYIQLVLIFFMIIMLGNGGCYSPKSINLNGGDVGGADALVTVEMPFRNGYRSLCTQGTNGAHSHQGNATRNDLDFDTPNDRKDIVFAPTSGVAYVHDTPTNGFGRHINIALGDGTYILLAHLDKIFVANGVDVGEGQVIAFEGTTGNSDGDHVHMGRHAGDPAKTADYGQSIATLAIRAKDTSTGQVDVRKVTDFVCALSGGHTYESQLHDVRSHPEGTLVQSPSSPDVFVLKEGERVLFDDESVFWSYNYDFRNVVMVSDDELACYPQGSALAHTKIAAAYDGSTWLMMGTDTDARRYRQRANPVTAPYVLSSWGITGSQETNSSVITQYPIRAGDAPWRDGTLVRETSRSDVYLIAGGVAYPVLSWELLARLGLTSHSIEMIPDGALAGSVGAMGNCLTGKFCVDDAFAESCGGRLDMGFSSALEPRDTGDVVSPSGDTDESPVESDTPPGDTDLSPPIDTDVVVPTADLVITWRAPAGITPSRITLSGVYAPQGVEQSWVTLASAPSGASNVTYTRHNVAEGDYLRFSVEYVVAGVTTWSCLAPFPPGRVQGSATATWNGQPNPVSPVADPMSAGCGLKAEVP